MSTRNGRPRRARERDGAEEVALLAHAKRSVLLRVHRFRLRPEDLEDCYSQATLELLTRVVGGARFATRSHLEHALEQRFLSRVQDRRRALAGRSPIQAAMETAAPLGTFDPEQLDLPDRRAELENLVVLRSELQRIRALADELTPDQRLVLAAQLAQIPCGEFCRRHGWSPERYRKVAQRGRMRLKALMSDEQTVPAYGRASDQGDRDACP